MFVGALLVRAMVVGGWVGWRTAPEAEPSSDGRIYHRLAVSLLHGQGFGWDGVPTVSAPPLYPLFLAAVYRVAGPDPQVVRVLQVLLSALTAALLFHGLWRRYGTTVAGTAAGLWAIHPLAALVSGLLLTETLFNLLLAGIVALALKTRGTGRMGPALVLGLVGGLVSLTRSFFLGLAPFISVWFAAGAPAGRRLALLAAGLVGLAVTVGPWTLRNFWVTGAFVPVQGNTGVMLWAGNNPQADGGMVFPSRLTWAGGALPDGPDYTWRGLSLSETNARYLREVSRWVREDPVAATANVLAKLRRLFGFARAGEGPALQIPWGARWAHWAILGMASAGFVLGLHRVRELGLFYLLLAYGVLTVVVFSGGTRYLMSILVGLLVFAAVAAEWLLRRGAAAVLRGPGDKGGR